MNKEFIPCEQALVLIKELGFNEPCFAYYDICDAYTKGYAFCYFNQGSQDLELGCLAPTFSQAFRWLLDKHHLYGVVIPTVTMAWTFKTMTVVIGMVEVPPYKHVNACDYSRREEAELACLKKLIEIVKNK